MTLRLLKELAKHEESSQHVHVTENQWQEYLHRDDVIVFAAEMDGSLVGYVSALRRPHLWSGRDIVALDDLYVQSLHRNRRIGERLMRAVADLARMDGLTVRWEVLPTNSQGQRFYSRLGAKLFTKVIASWTPEQYGPAT
jgi:ribosomal protein S18 acetylase RimI-like enzyme